MNGGMRGRTLIALIAIAVLFTGCPNKQDALRQIDALKQTEKQRERIKSSIRALTEDLFRLKREELDLRIDKRKAELETNIYRRIDEQIGAETSRVSQELESAFAGPIEELDRKVREERELRTRGAGNHTLEVEFAAQLGATLAYVGREKSRLTGEIRSRYLSLREKKLKELDDKMKEIRETVSFDPEVEAEKALKEFEDSWDAYDEDVNKGLEQLERYIESRRHAVRAFSVGLFGENLGKRIADKANSLLDKAWNKASEKLDHAYEDVMK